MRYLTDRIREAGGQLQQRGLDGLADLGEEGFDAVVVCCGLGAKGLVRDDGCYPIRGQVGGGATGAREGLLCRLASCVHREGRNAAVATRLRPHCTPDPPPTQIARVRAPWVRQCVFGHWGDETTYIIPNRDWIILGGTGQVGDWRTNTDLDDAESIMQRAVQVRVWGWGVSGLLCVRAGVTVDSQTITPRLHPQLLPSLASAELLDHWVGLRPGRCVCGCWRLDCCVCQDFPLKPHPPHPTRRTTWLRAGTSSGWSWSG
jgi:hypothetical protein